MLKKIASISCLTVLLTSPLFLTNTLAAQGEPMGYSCSDCPSYKGAFLINNNTNVTIHYQVRWGKKNPWKKMVLSKGESLIHSYPLGYHKNTKVPQPYVRFDNIGGDGNVTMVEYPMEFYAIVSNPGYVDVRTAPKNNLQPKQYFFEFAADRTHLNLFSQ